MKPSSAPSRLRLARAAVWCYFLIPGMTLATWTARLPAIKERASLSNGGLSLVLLAGGVGALLSAQFAGRLVDRYGSATVMRPAAVLVALTIIAPGFATNLGELVLMLLWFGVCGGVLDVSMNAHAVEVEQSYGRPIMASFHAVYSIGGLVGALYGGLLADASITPGMTFALLGIPLAVVALAVGRWLLPSGKRIPGVRVSESGPRDSTSGRWIGRIVFLGVLGMFCMLAEGVAADWGSVYMRDSVHASVGVAPLAYGGFSIAMAVGRVFGDRVVARAGRVAVVRWGAGLAALGLAGGLLIASPVAGIVGFAALGIGLSCVIPQLFTTAGNWDPPRAGRLVAQVTTLSYVGLLAGPVIIGPLSDLTSLSAALVLPAVLAGFVALSAPAMRPKRALPRASADVEPSALM